MQSSRGRTAARPLLWAVLTCAIASLTGTVAYSIGATRDDGAAPAVPAARQGPTAPGLLPIGGGEKRPARDLPAEDRAYLRGRRAGKAEGRREARLLFERRRRALERRLAFPGPGWYAVGVGPGGPGQPTQLQADRSYRLCRGGTALCWVR